MLVLQEVAPQVFIWFLLLERNVPFENGGEFSKSSHHIWLPSMNEQIDIVAQFTISMIQISLL